MPVAAKTYVAGLLIPASPVSAGAVVISLSGKAEITLSAGTALATTKSGSGGGGCSIMPVDGSADFSLLLSLFAILLYSLWRRAPAFLVKS